MSACEFLLYKIRKWHFDDDFTFLQISVLKMYLNITLYLNKKNTPANKYHLGNINIPQ